MTSYMLIYQAFLQKINDIKLANDLNINTEIAIDRMFGYLKSAIVNFNTCEKNLTDRINPKNHTDTFNGDGITINFVFTEAPLSDSIYTIIVDNMEIQNYIYDKISNSITFEIAPSIGESNVSITWNFLGQFNTDLSDLEQEILAMYMVYQWVSPFVNDVLQFKNYLQSNDFKTWSGSEFLKAKMSLQNQLKDMAEALMTKYSYELTDFSDFN